MHSQKAGTTPKKSTVSLPLEPARGPNVPHEPAVLAQEIAELAQPPPVCAALEEARV
jgi:hypothetical protein